MCVLNSNDFIYFKSDRLLYGINYIMNNKKSVFSSLVLNEKKFYKNMKNLYKNLIKMLK